MKKIVIIIMAVLDILIIMFLVVMVAKAEYVNSRNGLCVRSGPGTDCDILDVLPFGSAAAGEIDQGWMRLEQGGYVSADYLQSDNPFENMEFLGEWRITAYAYTGSRCANGNYPQTNYTIACNSLPFGSEVYVEDVGFRVVEDRGPDWLGDDWCDLYLGDYTECVVWGSQQKRVWMVKDEQKQSH